jgi:hypothetical protein
MLLGFELFLIATLFRVVTFAVFLVLAKNLIYSRKVLNQNDRQNN